MRAHTVYTVGHSTRSAEEFVALLRESGVQQLVDIRTVPRSRKNPQFDLDALPGTLAEAGIGHSYCKGLGGLRPTSKDSVNTAYIDMTLATPDGPNKAHIVSLALDGRPVPPGLVARHTCNVMKCYNPAHLIHGTHADNSMDMVMAGNTKARRRFDEGQVRRMRAEWSDGRSVRDLAREADCDPSQVAAMLTGLTYADVPFE